MSLLSYQLAKCGKTVKLQTRSLVGSGFDSSQPVEEFTTIREQLCGIRTVGGVNQGVSKFGGVNILPEATHLFCAEWDDTFPEMENRNSWVLYNGKRYLVLMSDDVDELNKVVLIQATERGVESVAASEA